MYAVYDPLRSPNAHGPVRQLNRGEPRLKGVGDELLVVEPDDRKILRNVKSEFGADLIGGERDLV